MKKITNILRNLRDQHRRTQDYMATRLGISQSQYNKIEKGDKPLDFDTLSAIAKIFQMHPKQLFQAIYEDDHPHQFTAPNTNSISLQADESQASYYKKMAHYFEHKFLKTYRMYIEIINKHSIEVPEAS